MSKEVMVLSGFDDVAKMFETLDTKLRNKILRPALRDGAKVIAAEARLLAPVKSGNLKKNIKVRAQKKISKKGRIGFVATVGKFGFFKGNEFYAGFLEYGHRIGKRSAGVRRLQDAKRSGKKTQAQKDHLQAKADAIDPRKKVDPKPFMRPAFDSKKSEVIAAVTARIRSQIVAVAKSSGLGTEGDSGVS